MQKLNKFKMRIVQLISNVIKLRENKKEIEIKEQEKEELDDNPEWGKKQKNNLNSVWETFHWQSERQNCLHGIEKEFYRIFCVGPKNRDIFIVRVEGRRNNDNKN